MNNEKNSKIQFYGKYDCNIEECCVQIPWQKESPIDLYYAIIKTESCKEKVFIYQYSCDFDGETLVDSGKCQLNEKMKWIVPKSVLNVIHNNECIFIGMLSYCEILGVDEYESILKQDEEIIKHLKNFL